MNNKVVIFLKDKARLLIQLAFFLYTIGIGARFYFYYNAVMAGDYSVTKPGGVEAFLPISALVGLKQLIGFGVYDKVHPAGLTIFFAAILISLLFKKGFCGYICPVGFMSESVSNVGFKVGMPKYIHYPLLLVKYILLALFLYLIVYSMSAAAASMFIDTPYNKIADAKMLKFFVAPSTVSVIVVAVIILLTLVFKNFWCRYLCPYGALLGLVSFFSPFKVKRNPDACISCKACTKACPMDIQVHKRKTVNAPECIGCMSCIKKRNNPECLNNGRFSAKPYIYALLPAGLFLVIFFIAYFTGNWDSSVTNEEYGSYLKYMDMLSH